MTAPAWCLLLACVSVSAAPITQRAGDCTFTLDPAHRNPLVITVYRGGQPLDGARLQASASMPSMPGMAPIRGDTRPRGRGQYVLQLAFPHAGAHQLQLQLTSEPTICRAEFPFPIAPDSGAPDPMTPMLPAPAAGGMFSSGTSQAPRAAPHEMLSARLGNWSLMFHGVLYATYSNQTGPRGRDKFFAPNWTMQTASRRLGPGVFTLRSMLTFEPATITNRRYPLLFQTGETAFGVPIINGQHPHDLFMELAASYQITLSDRTAVHFYGGPRGDPAMGPPAFPHRASASENPLAVISHHFQDSTHISGSVVTAGITHGPVTWELSGFHGQEPDEKRWGMEIGGIDSVSTRITVNPTTRWSGQFSIGRINNREVTHPLRDTLRTTASLMYARPLPRGHWVSSLMWGRNNDLAFTQQPGLPVITRSLLLAKPRPQPLHVVSVPTRIPNQIYNSFLAESTLRWGRNWIWGRAESTDKDTTLLFEEQPFVLLVDEQRYARVQLYTAGYSRELPSPAGWLSASLGGQITIFHAPPQLAPVYGANPAGAQLILRLRAGRH